MRITVWNENVHETRGDEVVLGHYPRGIHTAIADGLAASFSAEGDVVRTAVLQDPERLSSGRAGCRGGRPVGRRRCRPWRRRSRPAVRR